MCHCERISTALYPDDFRREPRRWHWPSSSAMGRIHSARKAVVELRPLPPTVAFAGRGAQGLQLVVAERISRAGLHDVPRAAFLRRLRPWRPGATPEDAIAGDPS